MPKVNQPDLTAFLRAKTGYSRSELDAPEVLAFPILEKLTIQVMESNDESPDQCRPDLDASDERLPRAALPFGLQNRRTWCRANSGIFLVPEMNLEGLRDPLNLLWLLHERGRRPYQHYFKWDWDRCRVGRTTAALQHKCAERVHVESFWKEEGPTKSQLFSYLGSSTAPGGTANSLRPLGQELFQFKRSQGVLFGFPEYTTVVLRETVLLTFLLRLCQNVLISHLRHAYPNRESFDAKGVFRRVPSPEVLEARLRSFEKFDDAPN